MQNKKNDVAVHDFLDRHTNKLQTGHTNNTVLCRWQWDICNPSTNKKCHDLSTHSIHKWCHCALSKDSISGEEVTLEQTWGLRFLEIMTTYSPKALFNQPLEHHEYSALKGDGRWAITMV